MAIDLITLSEYKTYAGISSTTQDAAISALIPRVSALVKSVCRRTFVDYVFDYKTDVFSGGTNRFILKETPLLQVATVQFSENYGRTYSLLTEYTDYVVDTENSVIELINVPYIDYQRTNAFSITYNAGYEDLPADLKLAVLDLIEYYIRNDSAIHSHKAIGSNSVQIEYITNTNLPAHIRRILQLHSADYV